MGCHALLQGIFPTQGSNPCLLFPALADRFFTASTAWEALIGYTPIQNKKLKKNSIGKRKELAIYVLLDSAQHLTIPLAYFNAPTLLTTYRLIWQLLLMPEVQEGRQTPSHSILCSGMTPPPSLPRSSHSWRPEPAVSAPSCW